jgi:hypothetical protein
MHRQTLRFYRQTAIPVNLPSRGLVVVKFPGMPVTQV